MEWERLRQKNLVYPLHIALANTWKEADKVAAEFAI